MTKNSTSPSAAVATRTAGQEQHTPGPFYVAQASGGPVQIRTMEGDHRVATLADYDAIRNARLISAAPELLAALQNMVGHYPSFELARETARAAIAKATGGAQ